MSDKPEHRVYRGVADERGAHNGTRLYAMSGGSGPTERERAKVLYQLHPSDPFWWGYGGGSPSRTATAILDDVLPNAMQDGNTLADLPKDLRHELTVAFLDDFIAYFHDDTEFWLPARTIVRWIQGFLREAHVTGKEATSEVPLA